MDFKERCPVCGSIIGYHINSYGRIVRQCRNCKHIIADDVVTTDKTTVTDYNWSTTTKTKIPLLHNLNLDVDHAYSITPPQPQTLEIKCDSLILRQNDISICFYSNKDIKKFDNITINGIKFKKVEEEDNDANYVTERDEIQNLISHSRYVSRVNYIYRLIKFPKENIPWLKKNNYVLEKVDYVKDFYKISW